MKKLSFLISTVVLFSLLSACASNEPTPNATNDANKVETIVVGTVLAIPTVTLTPVQSTMPVPSTPTIAPIKTIAPLYPEVTWENLGTSEQEILVNQQTNERITLSGYTFQASMPSENDLANNVYMYYSNENMASKGWIFMGGAGGTTGILTEFYNETGYFLTITFTSGQSSSIILWISDQTTIVPVFPAN